MTTWSGAPSSSRTRSMSSWASRSWITECLPCRLAIAMCARKLAPAGPCGPSPGTEVVQPGLADAGPAGGRPAPRSGAARRPDRTAEAPRWGAARPWPPRADASSASPTPHRDDATSTPTCTSRSTPDRAAARSLRDGGGPPAPSPPRAMSMWVWLSSTATATARAAERERALPAVFSRTHRR